MLIIQSFLLTKYLRKYLKHFIFLIINTVLFISKPDYNLLIYFYI